MTPQIYEKKRKGRPKASIFYEYFLEVRKQTKQTDKILDKNFSRTAQNSLASPPSLVSL